MPNFELGNGARVLEETKAKAPLRSPVVVSLFKTGLLGCSVAEWQKAGGKETYAFEDYRVSSQAVIRADGLLKQGKIAEAVEYVHENAHKKYQDRTTEGKWKYYTERQLAECAGSEGEDIKHLRSLLTNRASGDVLEAMCGYTSYFGDNPKINNVIAMDFCQEALELYDRPGATKVLFDLESIDDENGVDFIPDSSINTASISFGVDYLSKPLAVYEEFRRLLAPGGKFFIVGASHQGFPDLQKRDFCPAFHARLLKQVGFANSVELLPYERQDSQFYLVEATKR